MTAEVICALIAGISSIVAAAIGWRVRRSNDRAEAHSQLRRKESLLSLRMLDATLQLSVVASNALTNGHNNGNVERARKAAKDAADAYENFMREVVATEVSK